jgi:hypothetical protein
MTNALIMLWTIAFIVVNRRNAGLLARRKERRAHEKPAR